LTIAPWSWSISIFRMSVRVAHWSRRSPVTQASSVARWRVSGWTFRMLQQSRRCSDLAVEEVRPVPADHRLHVAGVGREEVELHAG
jgi:hypothetical protein